MTKQRNAYRGYRDLKVYQISYEPALDIHELTKKYPKEERYSLTDRIRRSSRSVPGNLAEAWKKRGYVRAFIAKVIDAAGEAGGTEVWLDFSIDFGYLDKTKHDELMERYDEVKRVLYGMIDKADKFCRQ